MSKQFKDYTLQGTGLQDPDDKLLIQENATGETKYIKSGNMLPDGSILDENIDWTNGEIWWRELGRTVLTEAADTISVGTFDVCKYLKMIFMLLPTGGTITGQTRFGNQGVIDTTNSYTSRYSANGGADTTNISQSSISTGFNAASQSIFLVMYIVAPQTEEKLVQWQVTGSSDSGSGVSPNRREGVAKWSDTSQDLTNIQVINTGTGDFDIGSRVIVLGHN